MLIPRRAKRSTGWLLAACVIVLIGHWIDVYVLIFPALEHHAMISLVDVAMLVGFASVFIQTFANSLQKRALIPRNDPYLTESLWTDRVSTTAH